MDTDGEGKNSRLSRRRGGTGGYGKRGLKDQFMKPTPSQSQYGAKIFLENVHHQVTEGVELLDIIFK